MSILWTLLPDEAMILVIVGIGFALMVGFIKGKTAMSVLGTVILFLLLGPFIDSLVGVLPLWLLLLLMCVVGMSLFRSIASLLLGRRAADGMMGHLAADAVRCAFRLLFFPFWILGRILRRV